MRTQLKTEDFILLMQIIHEHNQSTEEEAFCPALVLMEGEEVLQQNLEFLSKEAFLVVVSAYLSSGIMSQMPDLMRQIERETLGRLTFFSSYDLAALLKIASDAKQGSPEFYASIDKHIGRNLSNIEHQFIFPILKAFYDSGHARAKLFIKLQPQILSNIEAIPTMDVCALLRLYTEMEVKQSTFFEEVALHLERKLYEFDELGLVNALVAFKSSATFR